VPGYVRQVLVEDYQRVRAGDVLVQLVDDDYRAQVAQAEADVAGAEAAVANVVALRALQAATIEAAEAAVESARATLLRNRLEAERQHSLLATGLAGTRQLTEQADAAQRSGAAAVAQAVAQAEASRRQLGVYDAQERQQRAALAGRQAALDLARTNLGWTRIVAPVDGVVGLRQVRPGQYVATGAQVITLVPLPLVWITANFRETQLPNMRVGQRVTATVDALPGVTLRGHVLAFSPASGSQFSLLPPDNATGNFTKVVQRVPVKLAIDDAGGVGDRLWPGMSVVATVDTSSPAGGSPVGTPPEAAVAGSR